MEPKPVLLVGIDQEGKCELNPQGLEILKGIPEGVCVVTVAGLYRTGKSYLLNRLMSKQHGFEIGPSVNPCTKGIWIWGEPIMSREGKKVLLIDTEGLGSFHRDQTVDMTIFTLAVLLSSTFVYNCMGAIDEQTLEELSLVCKLSQHVHASSNSRSDFAKYFPSFVWAIRDFSLKLADDCGEPISPNQYLENSLESVEGDSQEAVAKNEIRKTLKEFFRERECFTFIRPVNQEKKLRNIQEVPYEELREEFRTQVETFVQRVLGKAKVKSIDGIELNGKALAQLLVGYVEAINNDAVPTISTLWERTLDSQLKDSNKLASHAYKEQIELIRSSIPLSEEELRQRESQARKDSVAIIENTPVIHSLRSEMLKFREKFLKQCNKDLKKLLLESSNLSKTQVSQRCKQEFENLEAKVLKSEEFRWVPEEFARIYEKVKSVEGPCAGEVLASYYSKEGSKLIHQILTQTERVHKTQVKELRSMLDQERRSNQSKLESLRAPQEPSSNTELKEYLEQVVSEFRNVRSAKVNLEKQYEYEMKITNLERNAQKQISEAKRISDQAISQLKRSYEKELENLREDKAALELRLKDMSKEILQRDMQNKLLNEKLKGKRNERKIQMEHSEMLCSVSDLIVKFLRKLETGKGDLTEQIDDLQEKTGRFNKS